MSTPLPVTIDAYHRFDGGIAPYDKDVASNQYAWGRALNFRDNPREIKLLPRAVKESGSITENLIVDGDRVDNTIYLYDQAGNIYSRSSAGSHTKIRTVANSHGNGMKYFGEDGFLYYASDKLIGRYGQMSGSPSFADDFLGSEGGVPLNTHWVDFEASSSQYASRADTASLSITGDLAIECTIKPESLPSVGNSMVLASKWDINSNKRSYKFEIYAISGYFGDGSDGALTISVDTTDSPIDSSCTGTSGSYSLSATNASFATGQIIYIHQTRGTGAGTCQRNKIASYTAGTITLETALNATYTTGAQVLVLKQYTNVTVNSGKAWTAKAWNGTVGGILAFIANGTITVSGTITATGKGFRGGTGSSSNNRAGSGEGTAGASVSQQTANGNGGGGGGTNDAGGGGGSNGTQGEDGSGYTSSVGGYKGNTSGTTDLTTITFGGAGGGGAEGNDSPYVGGNGGNGGGIIYLTGSTVTVSGSVVSAGEQGTVGTSSGIDTVAGGGGAGGSILVKAQEATLGSSLVAASGAQRLLGGAGEPYHGGAGGDGRIHLDYYTSYTGTTSPSIDATQDNALITTTTYQLRLGLSSDGTAEEFLTKNSTITTASSFHVGVSWDASAHQAEFFQDGSSLGTATGAVTSLNDNASVFGIAADFNTTARNFYDGKMDEVRVWNVTRTAAQMYANKSIQIATTTPGLVAYYQLNNNYDDSTSNANHMTASNTPVFVTDVPFSSPTSRLDLDQSLDTSGNTYTLATSISETATHRQTFVPQKDPQKSVEVLIAAKGTGDWTITIHDALNRTVASLTVANASLPTAGDYEFVFSSAWTPIRGASYHFHLTSTVNDGTVTTTTASDLETVDFHTYYQFLVTDTKFHPIEYMLNFLAFGNGRYVATYDAITYNPHRLVLPSGWKVRCLTKWREYLAIGCWKGTNTSDYDEGMIFFWDGWSTTYNFFVSVPEGSINAMFANRGVLFVWAGYQGDMLAYGGGDSAEKLRQLPKIKINKEAETLPKAVCMWQALLRWGVAGVCDSSDVERGVYTYGQKDRDQSLSLSYDYPISTGNRASTGVQIGFLMPVQKKLLVSWKDNTNYGVDVIDPAGTTYASGTIERDIKDFGGIWKEKSANTIRADFEALETGESIRLKYKLDRATNWTEGATDNEQGYAATVGDTFARLTIPLGNHKEVQVAADIEASGSTTPTFLELSLEEDKKPAEEGL